MVCERGKNDIVSVSSRSLLSFLVVVVHGHWHALRLSQLFLRFSPFILLAKERGREGERELPLFFLKYNCSVLADHSF